MKLVPNTPMTTTRPVSPAWLRVFGARKQWYERPELRANYRIKASVTWITVSGFWGKELKVQVLLSDASRRAFARL